MPLDKPIFKDPYSTVLVDKEDNLLGARIAQDGQWRFPGSGLPPENFERAILAFEDRYFYYHFGINPVSIGRALVQNLREGRIVSGGSTITMQVARMAQKNKPRTVWQKLKEMWLAVRLEVRYSKKEILAMYANNAPFGGNVVGLEAASWRYYGRSSNQLSWAEATNLAILPNAPSLIFPGKNDKLLEAKRNKLLQNLFNEGIIDQSDLMLGQLEPVPRKPKKLPNFVPHLLDRAISDGLGQTKIVSSISMPLQQSSNTILEEYHRYFRDKQINNAAVLVVEIETGESWVYLGNAGNREVNNTEVDIIRSRRSPGSLLKPFLYGLAIDAGTITPWQLLPDIPLYYKGFAPQNFDKRFLGAVKANHALRSSLNIPFVNLLRDYGYENFHHDLKKMGVKSLDRGPGHYGLTLVLGGGELTMWELATLYAGLVRTAQNTTKTGTRWQPTSYIANQKKEVNVDEPGMSAAAAWHTVKAMQELRRPDEESNWQQFGSSRPIAWKTGTSYGHKDAWSIGANSKYVVAVWMGNADGEGRPDLVGVRAASPLMFKIFGLLNGDAIFSQPMVKMARYNICVQSGQKANKFCPEKTRTYASATLANTINCQYHKQVFLDKTKQYQVNASCYPMVDMVPDTWFVMPPSQAWYYKKANLDYRELPEFIADCSNDDASMEMIYPRQYTKVFVPIELDQQKGRVIFEAAHHNPSSIIYWHIDDEFVGITQEDHHLGLYPRTGKHKLTLVDDRGKTLTIDFEVLSEGK